ncbi:hypothetical protein NIES2104_57850 [Leptolyngbya sp. NIES-2104]|nr:hypothetical protein NIES2104_57850 [Leptolyngbya sp. NIES-2104]
MFEPFIHQFLEILASICAAVTFELRTAFGSFCRSLSI